MVDIKRITTRESYDSAVQEIESLLSARIATPEGDRLDVLARLIGSFERAQLPRRDTEGSKFTPVGTGSECVRPQDRQPPGRSGPGRA